MGLNRYPMWKNLVIIGVMLLGLLYALPNLYGEDPAIQVSAKNEQSFAPEQVTKLQQRLDREGYAVKSMDVESPTQLTIRLKSQEAQLKAKDVVDQVLGTDDYVSALNLASATPKWLEALGASPMKLGLDLRGGVHFLMEVDVDAAIGQREKGYLSELRTELRKEKLRYRNIRQARDGGLVIQLRDPSLRGQFSKFIHSKFREYTIAPLNEAKSNQMRLQLSELEVKDIRDHAIEQSITTMRNRVNELGVAEAVVQRQGMNRIVVQLPGIQDTARAKEIIGKTATLEFLLVDQEADVNAAMQGRIPPGTKLIYDENNRPYVFKSQVILSGENIVGATSDFDEYGKPAVGIRVGGSTGHFTKVTRENKGKLMGTIYKETRFEDRIINGQKHRVKKNVERAISVATIRSALGNRFQISNVGTADEARNLALLLRAGALPAPVDIIEERTIGPSLGLENIKMGMNSIMGGLLLVLGFMAVYYRQFGVIANIALVANLVLLMAILSAVGATLTLPGIAGVVLTLGMAVDANVLIFERIREEIRNGVGPQACIYSGFEKALVTILDANITTFIAALVLFTIGSGPIKGFAVTLTIGLVTSVFTAVMVSRAIVNGWYGERRLKKLPIGI